MIQVAGMLAQWMYVGQDQHFHLKLSKDVCDTNEQTVCWFAVHQKCNQEKCKCTAICINYIVTWKIFALYTKFIVLNFKASVL